MEPYANSGNPVRTQNISWNIAIKHFSHAFFFFFNISFLILQG